MSLPATTFSYQGYRNKAGCNCSGSEWDQAQFYYPRLSQIDNGYGGIISAQYATPDDGYWHAHNYRVSHRETKDRGTVVSQVDYTYPDLKADRCYDNDENHICEYFDESDVSGGRLVGYRSITETLKTGGGITVTITGHDFHLTSSDSVDWRLGHEKETRYMGPDGALLREVEHSYQVVTDTLPTDVHFVHVDVVTQTEYLADGSSHRKRTEYAYDPDQQTAGPGPDPQAGQYGNLTHVREYDENDVLYRTTVRDYRPITTTWIVGKVARENVYDGDEDTGVLMSSTWFSYDGQPHWDTMVGDKGELTAVRRAMDFTVGQEVLVDTQYGYDQWGNVRHITTTNSYGTPNGYATGDPRVITTTYDAIFHTYPVTVENALAHVETREYYDVNESDPSTGYGLPGQLKLVTDANGATTMTVYDAFGRATKVIRPGDTITNPTVLYTYHDDDLEPATPVMQTTWRKAEGDADPWISGGTWVREFFDGLGRLIQVQTPYEDRGYDVVRFIRYDGRGLRVAESAPYLKPAYVYSAHCNGKQCNPYVAPWLNMPQTRYTRPGAGACRCHHGPGGRGTAGPPPSRSRPGGADAGRAGRSALADGQRL